MLALGVSTHALSVRPTRGTRRVADRGFVKSRLPSDDDLPTTYPDYVAYRRRREEEVESLEVPGEWPTQRRSQSAADLLSAADRQQPRALPKTMPADEEEKFDAARVMQKIRDAGVAGAISYGLVQLAFFGVSIPVGLFGYYQLTGHWPDLTDSEDQAKLAAEAFAFLNLSRLLIPLRIALALALAPGVQSNLVDRFKDLTMALEAPSAAPSVPSVTSPAMPEAGALKSSRCVYCSGSGRILCGHCLCSRTVTFLDENGVIVTQTCANCDSTGSVVCINCQGDGVMILDT